jgi:hypothetical protein
VNFGEKIEKFEQYVPGHDYSIEVRVDVDILKGLKPEAVKYVKIVIRDGHSIVANRIMRLDEIVPARILAFLGALGSKVKMPDGFAEPQGDTFGVPKPPRGQ